MVLSADIDLLNPPAELEKKKHKLKRLVQSAHSFFMNYRLQPFSDRLYQMSKIDRSKNRAAVCASNIAGIPATILQQFLVWRYVAVGN
ncbi:hypothetical protein R1flu_020277 [Riccia fluitans]|uniref:Uncharacterized protein n=1 Tax=Riccia fluitans TaxID=41844 RepID=A0ABD1ZPK8_9MARC